MVRKWFCLLLSLSVVLLGAGTARASTASVPADVETPFLLQAPGGNTWEVLRSPSMENGGEEHRAAGRPAPIIGAMGISFSVAVLMVLADQRKK